MSLNVIMLGAPGAGKGTQAERLAEREEVPKISTGDILRDAVTHGTALGRAARQVMEAGQLVGDDVMIALVEQRLAEPDARDGFVLDGFPRTVPQARALDALMNGRGALTVVHVVVPLDELVRRLSSRRVCDRCGHNMAPELAPADPCDRCGGAFVQRADDSEAVVRERLRVFERQTQPLVEHYRGLPTFSVVDGNRPAEQVTAAIRAAVERGRASVPSVRPA
jgi:adenylate kinase